MKKLGFFFLSATIILGSCGDPGQIDLPRRQVSGLKEAILTLKNVKGIAFVHLDEKDVIRHRLVKEIISAYKSIETE